MVKIAIRKKPDVKLVCFLQIAERGTQDFSTRLIKHTELGKRVLRLLLAPRIEKAKA